MLFALLALIAALPLTVALVLRHTGAREAAHDERLGSVLAEFRSERADLISQVKHPGLFIPGPQAALEPDSGDGVPSDLAEWAKVGGVFAGEPMDEEE